MTAEPKTAAPTAETDEARQMSRIRKLRLLFSGFFKIAALVVGGGYAILPVAEQEFVHRRKMLSETELLDMLAVVQSLPGIIAGNAALYIGFRAAGVAGALIALLGVVTPSVLIILAIALFLQSADLTHPAVQGAFLGAQAAITGLIAATAVRMTKKVVKGWFSALLAVSAALAAMVFRVSPVWIILAGAVLGIVRQFAAMRRADSDGGKKERAV